MSFVNGQNGFAPVDVTNDEADPFLNSLSQIFDSNQQRDVLLQELWYHYKTLQQQYQREIEARQREREAVRLWQTEKKRYEDHIVSLQLAMEYDPYVLILIDGDGMIFEEEHIRAGDSGGRKAAGLLQTAILSHVQRALIEVPPNVKVVCRVYANVGGLADALCRAGVVDESDIFEQFSRGFTRGKTLFDFVDVGPGKDRADEKIIETFRLFVKDIHCRHIFFGCSHDNGYARILEEYSEDSIAAKKVTLLQGVPFEKELVDLPFMTKKLPGIFRDTKIRNTNLWTNLSASTTAGATKNYNIIGGLPSRFPPPPPSHAGSVLDSPIPTHVMPNISRTPSASTLASNESSWTPAPKAMNWAAKAAAPAPPQSPGAAIDYKPMNRDEVIARNRQGQRVDPPCRDYDKSEVDRVKKLKMCNVHYLRDECQFKSGCTHSHAYKPTKDEISTLKLVARMAPCVYGSGCDDVKCIYGHRCPAPPSRNHVKGTKSCIFGEQCKFPPQLHDIDTNVVKTLLHMPRYMADLVGLKL